MYADDIVIIAENEDNLQHMLNHVYNWCCKWRLLVNRDKTNIVHFRKIRKPKTNFEFKYGNEALDVVDQYMYLGVILDQYITYNETAATLSGGAGRALGYVINKFST